MITKESIVEALLSHAAIDAIYLYGSRAKGTETPTSDWDLGILYATYERDPLTQHLRTQTLQQEIEHNFGIENVLNLVDIEHVPIPLGYNILLGEKLFDRGIPHVRRMENSILSAAEKDYGYFQ